MVRAIWRSIARKTYQVTIQNVTEQTTQISGKENAVNSLADHPVSEKRPAVVGETIEKYASGTMNAVNILKAIEDIPYFMKTTLTAIITPGHEDEEPC